MPAPVKTSTAAPERSLDQRMDALRRANDIRTDRAQLKRDLKANKASIQTLLLDPPEYVQTAKVFDMLLAVPKYGRVKTNRILNQCRISPSKTIGGLSERQRAELVSQLRSSGASRSCFVVRRPGGQSCQPFCRRSSSSLGRPGSEGDADRAAAASASRSSSSRSRRRRASRAPGEVDGRDYHFLSREEFDDRVEAGDFLEFATTPARCSCAPPTARGPTGRLLKGTSASWQSRARRETRRPRRLRMADGSRPPTAAAPGRSHSN